eukprot:752394-Hanusia_phi.AAC.2
MTYPPSRASTLTHFHTAARKSTGPRMWIELGEYVLPKFPRWGRGGRLCSRGRERKNSSGVGWGEWKGVVEIV